MESLLNKVTILQSSALFKKETPAQAFSYEFCEISKNASGRLLVFYTISREVSHYAILFCRIL